jgi:hypothetical protein
MKAVIQRGRIRIKPVPVVEGHLAVWLKKPMTEGNKPYVVTDIVPGRKFYDLPCAQENINAVAIL